MVSSLLACKPPSFTRTIYSKSTVRRAVCQNDHELVRVFVALLEALACAVNTGLNVRAVPVTVVRVDGVDIILNCCQLAAEVPVVDGLRCVGYNRDAHIRIVGQNLLRKSLRRFLCVLQPVSVILRHAQGAVDHQNDVGLFRRLRGLFAGYLDGNLCNTGFSSTHCADFSSFGPVVFSLVFVLTPVCAAGGSASAAIAEIGIMPTSISTASTMLKKRFFMFFFPPVSNFLMCFDAFLSAKVSCVSLYQNFSKKQVPKHPSKRPEILVLSSFPLKNSRF